VLSQKTKILPKFKSMHWLIWIGLVCIAFGTLLTIRGQQILSNRSSKLLQDKSDTIANLSQQNIQLSSELKKINQEIAATVTGGDSFCYLEPEVAFGEINTLVFKLWNNGKYPVYDLNIKIWGESRSEKVDDAKIFKDIFGTDKTIYNRQEWEKLSKEPDFITKIKEVEKKSIEGMRNCLLVDKNIGTFSPKKTSNIFDPVLLTYIIPKQPNFKNFNQVYSVNMNARNGEFNQIIKMDIKNGFFHLYSKVEKTIGENREVVREFETIESENFIIKNIR
jgi:hypothetical protein